MDYRRALFFNTALGLILDPLDIESLLSPEVIFDDRQNVTRSLSSRKAMEYLWRSPDWPERALRLQKISAKAGVRLSHIGMADYPDSWLTLTKRPSLLCYMGEPCWLTTHLISVVGSRTPSIDTLLWLQRDLSEFLRQREVGVVSGGARGIDQAAHRLAMDCGRVTVCVLPSGLLNPYPFGQEPLWNRIRNTGGCILSTYGLEQAMRKSYFHERNRWIAGLSPVCFVAEANRRSGSLITAQRAVEESREVCTLPVAPTATQGLGNLDLLNENAFMLRDHRDLLALWDRSRPAAFQGA